MRIAALRVLTFAVITSFGLSSGACSGGSGDKNALEVGIGDDASGGDSIVPTSDTDLPFDLGLPGETSHVFDVQPAAPQTITVTAGASTPTVTYAATLDGSPVSAGWSVDRGEIAKIAAGPSPSGIVTPSGAVGGLVTVTAAYNSQTLKRQVFVKLTATQNGPNSSPAETAQIPTTVGALSAGGGVGGVGGEGLGTPVTDAPTLAGLAAPLSDAKSANLTLLYPYDKTVFPRGMLAPLLQWSWPAGDCDAIQIKLSTTSGSFSWTGTFGRPAILSKTGGKFIRHPIPQDVWDMATNSAGGTTSTGAADKLTLSVNVAKGGTGYGPMTETWTIAPGRLAGTVYYNSYGTQLVKNSIEPSYGGGPQFGAAVLSIKSGDTGPKVVAGTPSPVGSGAGCRVCHTVSADGSKLIAQHGDVYPTTSMYDLKAGGAETVLSGYDNLMGWAALSADGKHAFTNRADLAAGSTNSALYPFPPTSPTATTTTGIPADLQAGTPTFSPDGKHIAFDFLGGTIGGVTGTGTQLVSLDYDPTTNTFSGFKVLATMPAGDTNKRGGFPSFFPTNDAVAYHYQTVASNHRYNTWHGAKAQIWWSDLKTGTAKALGSLNGMNPDGSSYLPTGGVNHTDDIEVNYEPTVNPVASGGYAWIVFTSRRLYGNVATTDPWQSDPRDYDATNLANATTKKLWVAAIDLSPTAGSDPSHPAFYLPAQELLAGNARGFWVLDPCRPDGSSCDAGDECCNGYCEPGSTGALVCTNAPPTAHCSNPEEKCKTAADCCDTSNQCINGFCAVPTPH